MVVVVEAALDGEVRAGLWGVKWHLSRYLSSEKETVMWKSWGKIL